MACAALAARDMMIDVDDGALATLIAGGGPTLVMLHGWTLDHRNWRPQLPLADHLRLVMPDRRGFGRSIAPADLAREWQDIDQLAGEGRFVLVGLSQGAVVALDYARRRPERLAGLVLVGAPLHDIVPHDDEEDVIPRRQYADLVHAGQLATMKALWAGHALVRTTMASRPLLEAMLDSYDGRDLKAPAGGVAIAAADIAVLTMPVLAMAGAGDTAWRRDVARFIGATAPLGKAMLIDDAGHLCNLDNPSAFNAILRDFLSPLFN
ncbi:alpha/beta fold hydrolase [Sphingomonas sp. 28-63-12]|uniref:alpha/beta fold hydrolase n=1 Tax=Sphingomonas sp. 28-63-12 TaxID=1970434 RepID=UPI000BCBFA62|nr:MAG: hypothetical protein B7Y47_00845 [Sphingomonas sp. 28-63-12]